MTTTDSDSPDGTRSSSFSGHSDAEIIALTEAAAALSYHELRPALGEAAQVVWNGPDEPANLIPYLDQHPYLHTLDALASGEKLAHIAAFIGRPRMLRCLIDRGCDVNSNTSTVRPGDVGMDGTDLSIRYKGLSTPLYNTVVSTEEKPPADVLQCAKMLLDAGANPNCVRRHNDPSRPMPVECPGCVVEISLLSINQRRWFYTLKNPHLPS